MQMLKSKWYIEYLSGRTEKKAFFVKFFQ